MKQNSHLSRSIMKSIHLCDCTNVKDGIDTFLEGIKNAKQIEDLPSFIIPLYEKSIDIITGAVYHYTGADALLSILCSGRKKTTFALRLSRVDYMNDIYDGSDVFNFISQECLDYELKGVSDRFKQFVTEMIEWLHEGPFFDSKKISYISSLTADGDSLPMWRNYTNKGGGYNLRFDTEKLWGYCRNSEDMFLIPVVYDYDLMLKILSSIFSTFSTLWDNASANENDIESVLQKYLILLKLSFKHPSFSHEQEIRLIKFGKRFADINENEKYAVVNGVLRPYIDVEIPKEVLIGVTVGPLLEANAAKRAVEDVIGANGMWGSVCNVKISAAPIRF